MWIRARIKIVERDDKGLPVRMVGTHTDITARKEAEKEIINSRDFLQKVIDGIPDEIIVIDPDYQILLANQAVLQNRERKLSDGLTCYQLLHHRGSPCEEADHRCPLR